MMKKLLAAAGGSLVLAVATAAGASAAAGGTTEAFLCYSPSQVDPGAYSVVSPTPQASQAQALLDAGYWSPFAETTVPTRTMISGGYYLDCQLPIGMTKTDQVVGLAGTVYPADGLSQQAGLYPLATGMQLVPMPPPVFQIPAEQ
jgi:hypothetical protein